MREIIRLRKTDKVPNGARPLGAVIEKELIKRCDYAQGTVEEVTVFYYDVEWVEAAAPVGETKTEAKEEKKHGSAKRR